ncbi:hypothetical protein ZWY2020_040509 [Hordeum vulgare]|nr:hypothetical protein ZWY2020_040509 [Hordeum vulgare]
MPGRSIPGVAHRRPATSTFSVVSTPEMEDEAYRKCTTALLLTAVGPCSGIIADMVAGDVEHGQGFPRRDICVAPCFPEDFLLVLSECHQRDLVFERRQLVVAGVKLLLRPWFPPPGGNRAWRFYCRVAIEGLPLNAWSWDNVQEVIGKKCTLDLIESQSTTKTNVSGLFAWIWAWDPDLIPRASNFNVISRPDVARPRRSLPQGTPSKQGTEGPHFPVLIHLDVVQDYTPVEDEDLEWSRIYEHKDWKMGTKDGERRPRVAVSEGHAPAVRHNDNDADDGYNDGARRRGKRSGAREGFWQGMRDRANCKDVTARAPAPRRYRRHVDMSHTAGIDAPVVTQQLQAIATNPTGALKSAVVPDDRPAVHSQQLPATVVDPTTALNYVVMSDQQPAVHLHIRQPGNIGTKALQTAHEVQPTDCVPHCEQEDSISDALNVTKDPADQDVQLVSQDIIGPDHKQAAMDAQEDHFNPMRLIPHELLPLYSPSRSQRTRYDSIPGWNGLFEGGATISSSMHMPISTSNPEVRGYDLPPLPPSLQSTIWD